DRQLQAFGETKTWGEWLEDPRCGIDDLDLLSKRLRDGWPPEDAIQYVHQWSIGEYTAFGETKSLARWACDERSLTRHPQTLLRRMKQGMTLEQALTTPCGPSLYTAFGETKTLAEWAADERCAVTEGGLRRRVQHQTGASFEEQLTTRSFVHRPVTAFGETKTIAEWAADERCSITAAALRLRLSRIGPDADPVLVERAIRAGQRAFAARNAIEAFGEIKNAVDWARDDRCQVTAATLRRRLRRGGDPAIQITAPKDNIAVPYRSFTERAEQQWEEGMTEPIPISLIQQALEHVDGDIALANTYRTGDGQVCFGAWSHMSTFVQLVHVSTLITMEEEFEDWAAPLGQMLRAVQTKPLNAGMTFYFPGWLAVGEDGKAWKDQDG